MKILGINNRIVFAIGSALMTLLISQLIAHGWHSVFLIYFLTLIPIVEQTSMRYVAGVFIQANRFGGYPSALATARAIVQAHNKAVKAARKACYDRKTQTSDR